MTAWIYRSQTYRILQQKMFTSRVVPETYKGCWVMFYSLFFTSHVTSRRGFLLSSTHLSLIVNQPDLVHFFTSLCLMISACFALFSFWYFTSLLSRLVFFVFLFFLFTLSCIYTKSSFLYHISSCIFLLFLH